MKKKLLSLLLVIVMVLGMFPVSAAASGSTVWAGSANYNDANNQVTTTPLPDSAVYTAEKWAYGLNTTAANFGTYYAGQVAIVDGSLYATGGGKLHKVDIFTGVGSVISADGVTVGTTGNYYDYLCYADGVLIVATQTKLEAFSLDGASLGSVSGSYGYYHPVQYHDGYIICNGYIYKLEKADSAVTFAPVGEGAIGGATFNWSSGAFVNGKFYVTGKTTVYAVDYTTGAVTDTYEFDASRTATSNTQGGVAYDAATGRLFWGTYSYNTMAHSIKVNEDGTLDKTSYLSADAGQKSVCTPVFSGGRVYLAGQAGDISVLNASDLSLVYRITTDASKIQSTPIVSTAGGVTRVYVQGYDGHLYVMTDNGENGTMEKLAETKNYSGVKYPNAYEQIAMDSAGNLYCYNESGYLFCFGTTECEVPSITTDLATTQVKIAKGAQAEALTVAASVTDGGTLSYQWQSSADKDTWTDIPGATEASYTPSTGVEATTYYQCVVTNTKDGKTAKAVSAAANILVKVLSSDTTLNVMVNGGNSATASTPVKAVAGNDGVLRVENRTAKVTNLWLGTVSDGTITSFEILQGLTSNRSMPSFTAKSSSNVYDGTTYLGYYRSTYYTLPIVAKASVTAEDGVTKATYYIVVDADTAGQYVVSVEGFTVDSDLYDADTGIAFTEADQTVPLTPVTSAIGIGADEAAAWTWTSSDVTVATVDANGVVTSVGGGTATITAALGRMTAACKVTSEAAAHTVHTYVDGACSVCGTKEPTALKAYFSLIGQDGSVAVSKDGTTDLYKTELSVNDADLDGIITLNDAFIVAHTTHSGNGAADFVTEDSSYGAFITKLWGVQSSNVGYYLNGASANGLFVELKKNDVLTAYFYQDTTNYSDVYTAISGQTTVSAGNATTYTVSGLAGGAAVVPKGAAVKAYDGTKAEVTTLATTVAEDGTFALSFTDAGTYTVEVSGTCSYTGSVWDYELNDYSSKDFAAAPVITSRMTVEVMPAVSKTVYISISTKSGNFAVNKNGDDMWRFPVTATDDPAKPDGNVTIMEVLVAAHEQYHPDGASAVSQASFITKLWGENNGGNCSYYFNDVYMSGSGTKTGTNGRPFQDKLLNTVVEDSDSFYIYSFQSTNWSQGDLYTYFNPVSESAVAGTPKTLTVKAGSSYGSNELGTSLVKVTDSNGMEQTELNTTVGEDGTFSITFPAAGTYTVEVRTNGTNYVTPSRCTVTVTAASGTGGGSSTDKITASISVVDPNGGYFLESREYTVAQGTTAADLLKKTDLQIVSSESTDYGFYVESINGIGEFDQGSGSGWMYKVNDVFPDYSAALYELTDGDYVEWVYTRDLGEDVGGGPSSGGTKVSEADRTAAREVKNLIEAIGTVTEKSGDAIEAARTAYDALTDEQKELVPNYDDLVAAEKKCAELTGTLPFSDVSESDYFYEAVKWAAAQGITSGTSETTFSPSVGCTRAQMVTFLWRAAGSPEPVGNETSFSDVDTAAYYYKALLWAVENSITSGTSAVTFSPDSVCTRAQMATFLYRSAKSPSVSGEHSFVDVEETAYYSSAVLWAANSGITAGTSATTFSPDSSCTRGQMVTFLYRYLAK